MQKYKNKLTKEGVRRLLASQDTRVHLVGVGGVSMYSLAILAASRGLKVTGSDRVASSRTADLLMREIPVKIGHDEKNVVGASLVVYSHAISEDNPELQKARELQIPTVSRAELLGAIMLDFHNRIGVSGTHGKSTTTAMLDLIFSSALCEPTTLSGANLILGTPIREGGKDLLLYEACEYRDSFLSFLPTVAAALNLEYDHPDYFKDIKTLKNSFRRALSHASSFAVVNMDDENLCELIPEIKSRVVTFGQGERADYRYLITKFFDTGHEFVLYHNKAALHRFTINVPGVHNVTNAVCAIVIALEYGIDIDTVAGAISSFRPINARLELIGEHHGRPVYLDYAHHPTEIQVTINTLKLLTRDMLTVVFKPHTYSRTAALFHDFSSSLSLADHIVLTDIYPAREQPIKGVSSLRLAEDIGERAIFSPDGEVVHCLDTYTSGAIVIMGAGGLDEIIKAVIDVGPQDR